MQQKRDKSAADAPLSFNAPGWLPLNVAFDRIGRWRGSSAVACRELFEALRDGQLSSVRDSVGGQEILTPEFWQQSETLIPQYEGSGVQLWPPNDLDTSHAFVSQSDLVRLYPEISFTTQTTGTSPAIQTSAAPPQRRRGPATTHDWHCICAEIACRCIDKTRKLVVPKNESALAKEMLQWCENTFGQQPSLSEMREAVRIVCAALRKI